MRTAIVLAITRGRLMHERRMVHRSVIACDVRCGTGHRVMVGRSHGGRAIVHRTRAQRWWFSDQKAEPDPEKRGEEPLHGGALSHLARNKRGTPQCGKVSHYCAHSMRLIALLLAGISRMVVLIAAFADGIRPSAPGTARTRPEQAQQPGNQLQRHHTIGRRVLLLVSRRVFDGRIPAL